MALGQLTFWVIAIVRWAFGLTPGTGGSGGTYTLTGPILIGDGTNSAPSYSFTNEPISGFYRIAAGQFGFSVAGTAAFQLTATGVLASGYGIANQTLLTANCLRLPDIGAVLWQAPSTLTVDNGLSREAAGIMVLGTGTLQASDGTLGLKRLQFRSAANASLGNAGGCAFDHFANGSSTSTDGTLDTLYTDTTVANSLVANGDKITADYLLSIVSSATATRRILISFAGITIFDSGALTYAATGTVRIYLTITRVTSTTCRAVVDFEPAGSATVLGFRSVTYTSDATLAALTLSGTNILVIKGAAAGTGAASADIVARMGTISLIPAGS